MSLSRAIVGIALTTAAISVVRLNTPPSGSQQNRGPNVAALNQPNSPIVGNGIRPGVLFQCRYVLEQILPPQPPRVAPVPDRSRGLPFPLARILRQETTAAAGSASVLPPRQLGSGAEGGELPLGHPAGQGRKAAIGAGQQPLAVDMLERRVDHGQHLLGRLDLV